MNEEYSGVENEQAADAHTSTESYDSQPPQQSSNVPLAALEDERSKRQQMERELEMYRNHFALQQTQTQPQQQQSYDEFTDDDIPTYGQLKKFRDQIESKHADEISELKAMQKYKDYGDVVTTYLPQALRENPLLRAEIERSTNKHELAYYIAKRSDAYMKRNQQQQANERAERIIQNTSESPSLASVGQSVTARPHVDYRSMDQNSFEALMAQNLGRSI